MSITTLRLLTDDERKEFLEKLLFAIELDPRAFKMAALIVNYWQEKGKSNRTYPLNDIP